MAARLEEIERRSPGRGDPGPAYWDAVAATRPPRVAVAGDDDPVVARVRADSDPASTVLDVGAGDGRIALALAPHVAHVTAVEQSRLMLARLEAAARGRGVGNVTTVHARWPPAPGADRPEADVVVCDRVLPKVVDVVPFVAALDAAARRVVVLGVPCTPHDPVLEGASGGADVPAAGRPTPDDALAVLTELGIAADVEVATRPPSGVAVITWRVSRWR